MLKPFKILVVLFALTIYRCAAIPETVALPSPTAVIPEVTDTQPPQPTRYLGPPATVEQEPPASTETAPPPTETATEPAPSLPPELSAEEAILILEPGPGSRVLSPVRIAGIADPTFEQHLLVRIVLDDGTELVVEPTIIQSDSGERGAFSIDLPFILEGERQAFIEVSTSSARDGGVTHLASVIVTLASSGAQEINTVEPHTERIVILDPALSEVVSGGLAQVSGYGLASFEQTLVVDVIDGEGNVVGSQSLIVDAPDLGQPGYFSVEVPYTIQASGPGRIVVRDPSVAFDGDVHVTSVEVDLEP